ncbi:type III-B CRISPR module-associated Cmr3 family protein [Nocardiopsis sp. NPDC006938]|uniref:type III-B CRISPR module-associated Cmr3 family protein n=1 Tax=Nocardiopsis sp. NPDC006938 TaxID=3364337 RepID=UPI0036CEA161
MPDTAPTSWLAVTPHDTIQIRDGRTFDAGSGGMAQTVHPWPSTIAGALVPALGGEPESVRGPILANRVLDEWELHFPTPLDLVRVTDRTKQREDIQRLRFPTEPSRASTDLTSGERGKATAGLRPLLLPEEDDAEQMTGVIRGETLSVYLRGELEDRKEDSLVSASDLDEIDLPLTPETRVGLGLDPSTRTARTGHLYRSVHLRLRESWAFCAEITPSERQRRRGTAERPDGPVRFGGLGRLADVCPAPSAAWPEAPRTFPDGRVLVYVATPAVWPDGWLPPIPEGAELLSACVGSPLPVATASQRRGHSRLGKRSLMWAVPPGSVYYLKFTHPDDAAAWSVSAHGRALSPAGQDRMDTAGFGVILTGVWS